MFKKQGQAGRRGNNRLEMERRGRRDEGLVLKKGPWTVEEDEVLVEFVRKYGPRDWSSIKAKGLLPRSGKSCRLRWVNKLKPDLKTGCKFTTEEERVVLELQARFGNKWARIATYLPGRTDNDVKNFWSTRQKRLGRMLQTAHHKKPQRNDGKPPVPSVAPVVQDPSNGFHPCGGEGCSTGECIEMPNRVDSDATVMIQQQLHDHVRYTMPTVGRTINTPFLRQQEFDRKPCLLDTQLPQFNFPHQLPHALLDLPVLPDGHEMDLGLEGLVGFQDPFSNTDAALGYDLFQLPFMGLEGQGCNNGTGVMVGDPLPDTPDSFFDDFPVDMLDNSDLPPPPPTDGVN